MTGQAQKQGFSEAQFKTDLCGRLQAMFNCTGGIKIDVKKYAWAAGTDPIARRSLIDLILKRAGAMKAKTAERRMKEIDATDSTLMKFLMNVIACSSPASYSGPEIPPSFRTRQK